MSPSVRAEFVSGPYFFLWRNIGSSYYTQTLLMTLTCVIKLTKGQKVARRKIAKLVTWSYLLMKKHCKFLFSQKYCFWPEYVSLTWPKVILARTKSLAVNIAKSLSGSYLIYENTFLLHKNIAFDLRPCTKLDPRSFGKGQWHTDR